MPKTTMTKALDDTNIIGIRFGRIGLLKFAICKLDELQPGDRVLVESDGMSREANVVIASSQLIHSVPSISTIGTAIRKL